MVKKSVSPITYFLLRNNNLNEYLLIIMACKHYKIPFSQYYKLKKLKDFKFIECEIKKQMNLEELITYCKREKWEANKYNVFMHNCQDFVAEIIKVTKAIRIHNKDKIRTYEKLILPGCIISQLWDNEKLSSINTIGRIPMLGILFDGIIGPFIK